MKYFWTTILIALATVLWLIFVSYTSYNKGLDDWIKAAKQIEQIMPRGVNIEPRGAWKPKPDRIIYEYK